MKPTETNQTIKSSSLSLSLGPLSVSWNKVSRELCQLSESAFSQAYGFHLINVFQFAR